MIPDKTFYVCIEKNHFAEISVLAKNIEEVKKALSNEDFDGYSWDIPSDDWSFTVTEIENKEDMKVDFFVDKNSELQDIVDFHKSDFEHEPGYTPPGKYDKPLLDMDD